MKTYISLLVEDIKYKKILSSAQKNDTLILLYSEDNDKMSLDMYNAFSSSKCNVEFMKITNDEKSNIEIAYLIGTLISKDIEIISDNETLVYLKKKISPKTVNKTTKASTKATNRLSEKNKRMPGSDIIKGQLSLYDVAENQSRESNEKVIKPKKIENNFQKPLKEKTNQKRNNLTSNEKEKSSSVSLTKKVNDDIEFEKQYTKLLELLSSVKTNDFDPAKSVASIVSAVKLVNKKEATFPDAIRIHCSSTVSEKIISSIKGKKLSTLKEIVNNLHDEL